MSTPTVPAPASDANEKLKAVDVAKAKWRQDPSADNLTVLRAAQAALTEGLTTAPVRGPQS